LHERCRKPDSLRASRAGGESDRTDVTGFIPVTAPSECPSWVESGHHGKRLCGHNLVSLK